MTNSLNSRTTLEKLSDWLHNLIRTPITTRIIPHETLIGEIYELNLNKEENNATN